MSATTSYYLRVFLLIVIGECQRLLAILLSQEACVSIWNLDRNALEYRISEWEEGCILEPVSQAFLLRRSENMYPELMTILAAHHPLSVWMRQVVARSCDVDKKTAFRIDPTSVDPVQFVRLLPI